MSDQDDHETLGDRIAERTTPAPVEVEIPSPGDGDPPEGLVSLADVSATDDVEVPPDLRRSFWWLVVVFNLAVLALGVGAMLVGFGADPDLGRRLLAAGAILSVYGGYKYWTNPYRDEVPDGVDAGNDAGETDGSAASADTGANRDVTDADPDDRRRSDDDGDGDDGDADDDGDGTADPHGDDCDPTHTDDAPVDDDSRDGGRAPAGTVRDPDGQRYLLVKRSGDASLVRDPATGREAYLPTDRLERVEESPLRAAAGTVPASTCRVLTAVHDDRSLGLLVEVVDRGPVPVRSLLADYDLCESDLHGLLGEFRAAGLLEEATVAGERGYRATETAVEGVGHLRSIDADRSSEPEPES